METSKQDFAKILADILNDEDITNQDIPQIDLYIDQIISLFESKLATGKTRDNEKLLTKTMVNNYSKEGLITPLKGKKYAKEQILQILFIYYLKQTLSIQDIKKVMQGVSTELSGEQAEQGLMQLNESYTRIKTYIREQAPRLLEAMYLQKQFTVENKQDIMLALLGLAATSSYINKMSLQLVDLYFDQTAEKSAGKKSEKA